MDSTPPSHRSEPRSSSRLAQISKFSNKIDPIQLNLDPTDSPKEPHSASNPTPLRDILLLSPSPTRKPRRRILQKPETTEEPVDLVIPNRRRCKNRGSPMGLLGCASPRNNRRSRRRIEQEDRDYIVGEENVKPKKRKQSSKSRKDKLSIVPSSKSQDDDQSGLDHIKELIWDLVMWSDVSKSSLWFGFGVVCILSSCFTRDYRYSVFSAISQLGLMFLGVSFFYNSVSQRITNDTKLDFKLTEEDIVRLARVLLPAINLVIAKIRELFSGEPSTTLKVAPILLFGAEFGHFITLWRLYVIGFVISFTVPKLYSCYSVQISKQAGYLINWAWDTWVACAHKKIVAASAATVFWNLSSLKTRIFSAFISVVILRYYRQHSEPEVVEGKEEEDDDDDEQNQQKQQQALVIVEVEAKA